MSGMSLGLIAVFIAFVALLVTVVRLAFRERHAGKLIAPSDQAARDASDARVLTVIFGAIIGGMILTLITAWLVFAR
jgi:hypothetical protein